MAQLTPVSPNDDVALTVSATHVKEVEDKLSYDIGGT